MVLVVRSIGRIHWNWNDAHQPDQPTIMNGRLISRKTAAVPAAPDRCRTITSTSSAR